MKSPKFKIPKWLLFFILMQLLMFLVLAFLIIKNSTLARSIQTTQLIQGPKGESGYTPIKGLDYSDGLNGLRGLDGKKGEQGERGIQGLPGPIGPQGDSGPPGEPGASGKEIELRCRDFANRKSQIQYRYTGDESWQKLYELSTKCNGESNGGAQ